jgi:hypothetical protein
MFMRCRPEDGEIVQATMIKTPVILVVHPCTYMRVTTQTGSNASCLFWHAYHLQGTNVATLYMQSCIQQTHLRDNRKYIDLV